MFKKLFYGIAAAFIATASVPPLLPACVNNSAQLAALRQAQAENPEAFVFNGSSQYLAQHPATPRTAGSVTMVPGNQELLQRDAQSPLIPQPEALDQQQATTSVPSQKKPLSQQNSVLKSLLAPFAYTSATLRALDPFTYIENFISKCVDGVTGFFGKRFLGKSIDNPMIAPMVMNAINFAGASFIKPLINSFVLPKTEAITNFFVKGSITLTGNAIKSPIVDRGGKFVGTLLEEYFKYKLSASCPINIHEFPTLNQQHQQLEALNAQLAAQTTQKFTAKEFASMNSLKQRETALKSFFADAIKNGQTIDEYMTDITYARILILGANVIHLLGDLHNLLFTEQTRGNDTLDKYLKMSATTIRLAETALFTYQTTSKHAHEISADMKKYLEKAMEFVAFIKKWHTHLEKLKPTADAHGITPAIKGLLGIKPSQEEQEAQLAQLSGMLGMAGQ